MQWDVPLATWHAAQWDWCVPSKENFNSNCFWDFFLNISCSVTFWQICSPPPCVKHAWIHFKNDAGQLHHSMQRFIFFSQAVSMPLYLFSLRFWPRADTGPPWWVISIWGFQTFNKPTPLSKDHDTLFLRWGSGTLAFVISPFFQTTAASNRSLGNTHMSVQFLCILFLRWDDQSLRL